MSALLEKLKKWRIEKANLEGVEDYKIMPFKALQDIVEFQPEDKEQFLAIKGVGEKRFNKYGLEILAILAEGEKDNRQPPKEFYYQEPLSISSYLDSINYRLRDCRARIRGEISSLDKRSNVIYFTLKDSLDSSVMNCLMWKNDYDLNGLNMEIGMEIIAEGQPDIFKPIGKIAFKTSAVELIGEGALKLAYDKLKGKLEQEGLFSVENKKVIPALPQKIGLITSERGAVINDLLNNLGRYGFIIKFRNSRVEGQGAIKDLVMALDYFLDQDIDVLVITRGGGSLESLQAFNNENLVRKIAAFPHPVICGIGHDKDVPLASLAADKMVSTASVVAHVLSESWVKAISDLELNKEKIFNLFNKNLLNKRERIDDDFKVIENSFILLLKKFQKIEELFKYSLLSLGLKIKEERRKLIEYPPVLISGLDSLLTGMSKRILSLEELMLIYNPERQLRLGYSIIVSAGKILKTVTDLHPGHEVEIRMQDGSAFSEIKKINK